MSAIEIFKIIAAMIGGLTLFLFGMNTMSDALSTMTGGFLDRMLGAITKNRFTAFLFGTLITAIVQSASAVSVLTVGLVNSGIIRLQQAVGLLIGAALGTTATSWLLSLNAVGGESFFMTLVKPSSFAPFVAIAGVAITMFSKNTKLNSIANALLGFAVMMMGMTFMGQGVAPLKELPQLKATLMSFTNPILGFLCAVAFTMLIQSSDATVGIVQAFALTVGVTYGMAIPLICGAQVGTCVTALISSLGTSNSGKRTAMMNLYYALLKVIPFLILFYGADAIWHFSFLKESVGGIGIPICHTGINLLGAAVWLTGAKFIVFLAKKTIPYSEEERLAHENKLNMLDDNLLSNTSIALTQTDRAVGMLAMTVGEAMQSLLQIDSVGEKATKILLDRIHQYREQIESYITKLSAITENTNDTAFIMLLTNACTAFGESVGIVESIISYISKYMKTDNENNISDEEKSEVIVLGSSIAEILELTIAGYEAKDLLLSGTIQLYREEVMQISDILKRRHYKRSNGEKGRMFATTIYTDICYTEERLIDYCDIVADSLIKYNRAIGKAEIVNTERMMKAKKSIHNLFMDKYDALKIGVDKEGRVYDLTE